MLQARYGAKKAESDPGDQSVPTPAIECGGGADIGLRSDVIFIDERNHRKRLARRSRGWGRWNDPAH